MAHKNSSPSVISNSIQQIIFCDKWGFMPHSSLPHTPKKSSHSIRRKKGKKSTAKEHVIDYDEAGILDAEKINDYLNWSWVSDSIVYCHPVSYPSALTFLHLKSPHVLNIFSQPTHQIKHKDPGIWRRKSIRSERGMVVHFVALTLAGFRPFISYINSPFRAQIINLLNL